MDQVEQGRAIVRVTEDAGRSKSQGLGTAIWEISSTEDLDKFSHARGFSKKFPKRDQGQVTT